MNDRCLHCDREKATDLTPWLEAPWDGRLRQLVTTGKCARHLDDLGSQSTRAAEDCRNNLVDWRTRALKSEHTAKGLFDEAKRLQEDNVKLTEQAELWRRQVKFAEGAEIDTIWVVKHILHDGQELWWRPSRCNYVSELIGAGCYTEEEARSIERLRPPQDRAVRLTEALTGLQLGTVGAAFGMLRVPAADKAPSTDDGAPAEFYGWVIRGYHRRYLCNIKHDDEDYWGDRDDAFVLVFDTKPLAEAYASKHTHVDIHAVDTNMSPTTLTD